MYLSKSVFNIFSFILLVFLFGRNSMALEVGDAAPCVVLDGVSAKGEPVRGCIRDVVNKKHTHTIIDFFSIICSTCKMNIPLMSQLSSDLKTKATVRYVSIDRNQDEVKAFLKSEEIVKYVNFPTAFDVDRDAKGAYGAVSTPTLFILNRKNDIVYKHTGLMTAEDSDHIKKLIQSDDF